MEQINLNLIPGRAMPVCHVSQYDVERTIRCNLFEGDTVFALATGDTAEVHVRKPDDTVVTASLTVVNAQTYLDIKTTQQMDAVAGSNLCEIQLTRSGATLGTLNFIMEVEADPMDGGAIGSQSEIRDLQAQVDAAVDVKMGTIESELQDIRNGADGITYPSAGDAVRGQISYLSDAVLVNMENQNLRYLAKNRAQYVKGDGTIATSNGLRSSDYLEIPEGCKQIKSGSLYYIGNNPYHLNPALVYFDAGQNVIKFDRDLSNDYFISQVPVNAKYVRFNQPNRQLASINNCKDGFWFLPNYKDETLGLVGEYTGAFAAQEIKDTKIELLPNKKYLIRFYGLRTNYINLFIGSDSANYETIKEYDDEVYFEHANASAYNLRLYNPNGQTDAINLKVFEIDSAEAKAEMVPKRYTVGPYATQFDFTSVTECFLALKDDDTPKIIDIYEGDYDIFQEYKDAGVPVYTGNNPAMDFPPYCVFIPRNTHVIGHGIVRLKWMPNKTDNPEITWMQCYAVSPVNVMGSMTLENVEIHCKNGRYCIHNDTIGLPPYAYEHQKFINVKCYKYEGEEDTTTTPGETHIYGTRHTTGFGMGRGMKQEYINCEFYNEWNGRAFYGHTNQKYNNVDITEQQSGEIILDGCIIDTTGTTCIKLGNSGTVQRNVRTKFNNCYINHNVVVEDEASAGGSSAPNSFNLTFLNCGDVALTITDPNNPYTPKAYRTNLT